MKKYFYFLIAILLTSCGKNSPTSDLQLDSWKGNIKTITRSTFIYDSTKAEPHLGKLISKSIRCFNSDGYETSYTSINEKDEIESIRKNSFNENKIKIESKETDKEGNLMYTTAYKYDKNYNLIESSTTDHLNNSAMKQINKYDNKSNLIGTIGYMGNNEIDFKAENKYNEQDQLIEENIYLADGTLDYRAVNGYDKEGRIIINTGYAKDKSKLWQTKNEYKVIDKEGNWLLKYIIQNNVLVKVEQVQIEYYP